MKNNKYVARFMKQLVFGSALDKGPYKLDNLIKIAVGRAYAPAFAHYKDPRKLNDDEKKNKKNNIVALTSTCIEKICNKYKKGNFDGLFYKGCENLEDQLNKPFQNISFNFSFGVVQKIVNMSFKYLYCLLRFVTPTDKKIKKEIFNECHLTIDDKILNKMGESKGWQKLKRDEYERLQEEASKVFNDEIKKHGSLFFAEFYLWSGDE